MTITVIVLLIFLGFIYFKFSAWMFKKKYYKEYKEIFEAHKKLGYPPLPKETQFHILDTEDMTTLKRLTRFSFVPTGLLDHYITVEPEEYYDHLKKSYILYKMDLDRVDDKLTDGFYIEKSNGSFNYIFNDRRSRVFTKKFKSEESLLKYLVYDRLRMYAPKYRKRIKKSYYAKL